MRKETSDFVLKIVFVILAIVIIYVILLRHPKFLDWLKGVRVRLKRGAAVFLVIRNNGHVHNQVIGTRLLVASWAKTADQNKRVLWVIILIQL